MRGADYVVCTHSVPRHPEPDQPEWALSVHVSPHLCGGVAALSWAPWGPSGGRSGFSREGVLTEGQQAAAGKGLAVAGSRAGWCLQGPCSVRLCVQDACRAARVGPSQAVGVRSQLQPLHQHVGPSRG